MFGRAGARSHPRNGTSGPSPAPICIPPTAQGRFGGGPLSFGHASATPEKHGYRVYIYSGKRRACVAFGEITQVGLLIVARIVISPNLCPVRRQETRASKQRADAIGAIEIDIAMAHYSRRNLYGARCARSRSGGIPPCARRTRKSFCVGERYIIPTEEYHEYLVIRCLHISRYL